MTGRTVLEDGRSLLSSGIAGVRMALSRPTASDVATICCTLLVAVVVGSALVGVGLAVFATASGLAGAVATVLLASERPLVRAVGGVVAVPAALLIVLPVVLAGALVVSSGVGLFAGVTVWALVVAGLASGLVSWRRLGDGGAGHGGTGAMLAAAGVVALVVVRVLPESTVRERAGDAAADVFGTVWAVLVVADGSWAFVWFAVLLFASALSVSSTLASLPLERLVPPDRADRLDDAVEAARRGCSYAVRIAIVLALAAFVVPAVSDRFLEFPTTPREVATIVPAPVGTALATVVTLSALRLVLVALLIAALSLAALEWGRRTLHHNVALAIARVSGPAIGAALIAVVAALVLSLVGPDLELAAALAGTAPPSVVDLVASLPPFALAAAVLVVALTALSAVLYSVTLLRALRILPGRAIGGALAAGSVFVLAIGLAVVDRVELAIVTAVGAFVLWDVGEYADVIRTELGRDANTLRAELVHVVGTALSGAVVAGGTIVLYRWVGTTTPVTDPTSAAIALGTGLFAVVLVAWSLRG
ncbi:DUF7519 family protein [Natrarchaeobius chitinivorans]|uniref:Uncharacterized protein n=1 Tax=Natrarchaeobius chitinivorans TaxID=1679083 RepID=A0A3N6P7D2_NATCH|nr:hypothetical protein [Natrarchaeobius chitinivorans]RQG91855.1 hypothetical protein EA473_18905 [Natrarchaeobius chitinivorans]